ncbi:DUF222 domain-containing protein [Nocardia arthritidis]|uniref:DUF222 domain-containing protein n=1 Tax=Nocardia arthritidis TaxID=228602 RepID=A0A6G9YNN4_9NOCA|nr:DUF222 domain-containing protein [Nocardia arthritidis]QIS14818.1 DUF222 domain-containing protein [Nocardia arthritidis]
MIDYPQDRPLPPKLSVRSPAVLKHALSSGVLGEHRGLPVTAILTDVENASGVATTASGGLVPIRDALRLAENAHQYLAIFDHHGLPLHLGRQRRLANRYQRLALIASTRGCTRPGCDAPATLTAVHHVSDWTKGGSTDIENLTPRLRGPSATGGPESKSATYCSRRQAF